MYKSAVSSHIVRVYTARKKQSMYYVNMNKKFDSSLDIIDVIEKGLTHERNYNLQPVNSNQQNISAVKESPVENPSKKMKLLEIISKGTERKEQYNAYKYLFFKVEYGENGQTSKVEKIDGTEMEVTVDDYQHRIFHVFLAYPYGDEVEYGVLLLESRGAYSIQTPITKVIKNCLSKEETHECLTAEIAPFADNDVIKAYITHGKVSKLRLIKNREPTEHGQGMQYEQTEIIYKRPKEGGIAEALTAIANNTFRVGQPSHIKEIDEFQPDIIKFEVETESGKRTYTAGNPRTGMVQEEMPKDVVLADGTTHSQRLLEEMKRIFENQHLIL